MVFFLIGIDLFPFGLSLSIFTEKVTDFSAFLLASYSSARLLLKILFQDIE